jgi:nucleoside-diphosphate-sugar epimerase
MGEYPINSHNAKVLVTGGTGFLGRALVPLLTEKGYRVRALVRPSSRTDFMKKLKNTDLFEGDLEDEKTLKGIEEDIDFICHLAVLGHLNSGESMGRFMDVNVAGSLNLLNRFRGRPLKKILFATTTAALGLMNKKMITEEDFAMPGTKYGVSKYEAEKAVREYCGENHLPLVMVRLSHVYGPGESRDLFRMIKMMKKGYFPQVGISPNLYPAVYIDDAAEGVILAMEKGREMNTYILTDHESHDTRQIRKIVRKHLGIRRSLYPIVPKYPMCGLFYLTDWIGKLTGKPFPVTLKNIRYISSGRRFSIGKAVKDLGYHPKVSLEEGLARTLDFYKKEKLL